MEKLIGEREKKLSDAESLEVVVVVVVSSPYTVAADEQRHFLTLFRIPFQPIRGSNGKHGPFTTKAMDNNNLIDHFFRPHRSIDLL